MTNVSIVNHLISGFLIVFILSAPGLLQADNDCTAAKPKPIITETMQKKLKSYKMAWDHTSGQETGIVEVLQLNSGLQLKVVSGGCESYGVEYTMSIDGQMKYFPEELITIDDKYRVVKNWIEKAAKSARELELLGLKLKGLENIMSVKKPYDYLSIYIQKDSVVIELSDEMGYETSRLEFRQKLNNKVDVTTGHGFLL